MTEAFRAGIGSVGSGQRQAGLALGMTTGQLLRRVVWPLTWRRTLPIVGSIWVGLFKDSALVSLIQVHDLMFEGRVIANRSFRYLEVYTVIALLYYAISFPAEPVSDACRPLPETMERALATPLLDPQSAVAPQSHFVVVEGVHKSFGGLHVLRGVSLTVSRGEVVCIIGPSGSGKSTLLKCINGLERTSSGRIIVDGEEVTASRANLPKLRRDIGMVFQPFNLFPHLTVMAMSSRPTNGSPGQARNSAGARPGAVVHGGTGRQGRRLAGQAVRRPEAARRHRPGAGDGPQVMLFDEPTSALDPELVGEVLDVMRELAEAGMTMIVVTHEIRFAERVAHRVLMVDQGIIIESAAPSVLLHNATHPRTRSFLQQLDH